MNIIKRNNYKFKRYLQMVNKICYIEKKYEIILYQVDENFHKEFGSIISKLDTNACGQKIIVKLN